MQQELLAKYDVRLPRYTSYPTAPHFGPTVEAGHYAQWLGELPSAMPLSLYLHIAYCAEMCWFCGCHTKITQRYAPIADYLEVILREIDLVADRLPTRMTASHIHFGGGTPTILSAPDLARLLAHLQSRFALTSTAEVAIEIDPRTCTEDYVRTMADAGVTRVSLGVQDFNPVVMEAVNRVQPYELVAQVIGWLRHYGIGEISLDLIYGLPYQTVASVLDTIDQAMTLNPRRISLFGYAHVPWMKKHQTLLPEGALPDIDERLAQAEACNQRLAEHGFVAVGLDHFARADDTLSLALAKGTLHRNFQGYTTDSAPALIAFGASGIGALPQGYVCNDTEIHGWKRAVRAGALPIKRGIALTSEDRLRREAIERIMCDLELDVGALAEAHGRPVDHFDSDLAGLDAMIADGLMTLTGRTIAITLTGRPLVRAVAAVFDQYLKKGEQRHSKAV